LVVVEQMEQPAQPQPLVQILFFQLLLLPEVVTEAAPAPQVIFKMVQMAALVGAADITLRAVAGIHRPFLLLKAITEATATQCLEMAAAVVALALLEQMQIPTQATVEMALHRLSQVLL
jgi:hypothetical protein